MTPPLRLAATVPRGGYSLLEVLIGIGISALLFQLLLPAIQATREAARRRECAHHLRNIGMATSLHVGAFGYYPTGGWHYTWIGEPERGTGIDQPGGWVFNLLAFVDQSALRDLGRNLQDDDRFRALTTRCRTVLPMFHCPTRREARAYPQRWNRLPHTQNVTLSQPLGWVAKTDYAANVGVTETVEFDSTWQAPRSLKEGDDPSFAWPDTDQFNGIIFGRSHLRPRHVRDGLSKTYLVAEKYVDRLHYDSGEDWGDNENLFTGFNNDHCRSALSPPRLDQAGADYRNSFGSAHASVWQAVMVDGSVRAIPYDIDLSLHHRFGNRADGR